jgi:predicted alpha-1,2-mannosidase
MNGNHVIVSFLDAQRKALDGVDYKEAYRLALNTLETATITPWVRAPANELDAFYKKHGYFPALREDERETVKDVNRFERRQSVAVTLGASYDDWALSELAKLNGDDENHKKYSARSQNFKNLWNADTQFFHPKDKSGKFIEPFDYRYSGGMGFRDYYDENNGYTYRWNLAFDPQALVDIMGGSENFAKNLDELFITPLGKSRQHFYVENGPDQTGNIGQFAMGNEPSFHIPYLYNHAGQPWKTQKMTRLVTDMWFRNDLMGIPGDEDGGAMSAYVVFTMLGVYPTSPGKPVYDITGPYFEEAEIDLGKGNTLKIIAKNAGKHNKYVKSVKLNGKEITGPQIEHKEIGRGGLLEFEMSESPNYEWGRAK